MVQIAFGLKLFKLISFSTLHHDLDSAWLLYLQPAGFKHFSCHKTGSYSDNTFKPIVQGSILKCTFFFKKAQILSNLILSNLSPDQFHHLFSLIKSSNYVKKNVQMPMSVLCFIKWAFQRLSRGQRHKILLAQIMVHSYSPTGNNTSSPFSMTWAYSLCQSEGCLNAVEQRTEQSFMLPMTDHSKEPLLY